jgi:hypothetical protein
MSFQPLGDTVNINISGTSQPIKISDAGPTSVRVFNDGSATVWIAFGTATLTTAATTGIPIGTKASAVFTVPAGSAVWVAGIAASTTGIIYFTPGAGD